MSRFVATTLAVACLTITSRPAHAQTVVIVHKSSAVSDVKLDNLRRFSLGQGALTANGQQALLVELSPIRTRFYKRLLGLTSDELRRRWIAMVFRGDALALPFELPDAAAVKKFVYAGHRFGAFVPYARYDMLGYQAGDPYFIINDTKMALVGARYDVGAVTTVKLEGRRRDARTSA